MDRKTGLSSFFAMAAPVTGQVADGQKNRLVLFLCHGKGILAPRLPVDRV
jgi:hypothetical protein